MASTSFFVLPKELRDIIYSYVATAHEKTMPAPATDSVSSFASLNPHDSGLPRTCHRIRQEYFNEVARRHDVHFVSEKAHTAEVVSQLTFQIRSFFDELEQQPRQRFKSQPLDLHVPRLPHPCGFTLIKVLARLPEAELQMASDTVDRYCSFTGLHDTALDVDEIAARTRLLLDLYLNSPYFKIWKNKGARWYVFSMKGVDRMWATRGRLAAGTPPYEMTSGPPVTKRGFYAKLFR